MLNGDLGANYNGIQISSGVFHMWRAWGITNESELMALAIGAVVMAALMLHAGIFHYHKACLLYTSPSPRDATLSRMPSSA